MTYLSGSHLHPPFLPLPDVVRAAQSSAVRPFEALPPRKLAKITPKAWR